MRGRAVPWDRRFMGLARHIAEWSKDPSTKCGAVIVRPDRTIAAMGFNGFPMGVEDVGLEQREHKYERIIHAEMNALLFLRERPVGYTLYTWPFGPCCRCAAHIAQSGIGVVISNPCTVDRWTTSIRRGMEVMQQAGVQVHEAPSLDRIARSPDDWGLFGPGEASWG